MPKHEQAKAKRDQLAERLRALYQPFVEQIVPLLHEIKEVDAEVDRANASKLVDGGPRSLRSVELEARNIDGFGMKWSFAAARLEVAGLQRAQRVAMAAAATANRCQAGRAGRDLFASGSALVRGVEGARCSPPAGSQAHGGNMLILLRNHQ